MEHKLAAITHCYHKLTTHKIALGFSKPSLFQQKTLEQREKAKNKWSHSAQTYWSDHLFSVDVTMREVIYLTINNYSKVMGSWRLTNSQPRSKLLSVGRVIRVEQLKLTVMGIASQSQFTWVVNKYDKASVESTIDIRHICWTQYGTLTSKARNKLSQSQLIFK